MKALRVITTQGSGKNTIICDVHETYVTIDSMVTRGGYIQKTLGTVIMNAIRDRDKGAIDHILLEVIE